MTGSLRLSSSLMLKRRRGGPWGRVRGHRAAVWVWRLFAPCYSENGILTRTPGKAARRGASGMRRLRPGPAACQPECSRRKLRWHPGRPCHWQLTFASMARGVGRRQRRGNWPGALTHDPPVAGPGPRVGGRPCASLLLLRGAAGPQATWNCPAREGRGRGGGPARLPGACRKRGCTVSIWEFGPWTPESESPLARHSQLGGT